MKAYLATTGTVFGLMAVMHLLNSINDRHDLSSHPGDFLIMASLGLLAASFSVWAWCLFCRQHRS